MNQGHQDSSMPSIRPTTSSWSNSSPRSRRVAALFYRINEPCNVFEHAIDGFDDEFRRVTAGARGEISEPRLFLGRQLHFHGFPLST
jgi:hypothetical protein